MSAALKGSTAFLLLVFAAASIMAAPVRAGHIADHGWDEHVVRDLVGGRDHKLSPHPGLAAGVAAQPDRGDMVLREE